MSLQIVHYPHKALLTRAEEVTEFDQSLKDLVKSMEELMSTQGGIGLAANQVNILKRVIVVNIPDVCKLTLINPEIVSSNGKDKIIEGCLSFPTVFAHVQRPSIISIKFQDTDGKHHEAKDITGLVAVCIQHEIDHLNGIVFTQRMSRLNSSITKKKMEKMNEKFILNT